MRRKCPLADSTMPLTLRPVSVRVPVLSKQMVSSRPANVMTSGLDTKISERRSREIEIAMEMARQAGNAGGTAIVIKSSSLSRRVPAQR